MVHFTSIYHTFKTKNKIGKICNMKKKKKKKKKSVLQREKKTRLGFQKAFFQKVHLEKGGSSYNKGRLIFWSVRYSKNHGYSIATFILVFG